VADQRLSPMLGPTASRHITLFGRSPGRHDAK